MGVGDIVAALGGIQVIVGNIFGMFAVAGVVSFFFNLALITKKHYQLDKDLYTIRQNRYILKNALSKLEGNEQHKALNDEINELVTADTDEMGFRETTATARKCVEVV